MSVSYRLTWFLKMEYMAGSARKEPDEQTRGPELESLEPRHKCWVQRCVLVTCNSSTEETESAGRAGYCFPGISSVACKHAPLHLAFLCGIWAANSGHGCVANILTVELSAQPSSLVLKHSLIMICEVCLLFKYNTMEISIFNVSVNFGL